MRKVYVTFNYSGKEAEKFPRGSFQQFVCVYVTILCNYLSIISARKRRKNPSKVQFLPKWMEENDFYDVCERHEHHDDWHCIIIPIRVVVVKFYHNIKAWRPGSLSQNSASS